MPAAQTRQKTHVPVTSLGGRVRQARIEAKLSLAAVAKNDFSRAFLNQVELGRSRPSPRNLKIIAERLGRPVDFFLQDETDNVVAAQTEFNLLEAELALLKRDPQTVLKLLESAGVAALALPDRMTAQLYRGEALVELRRGAEALEALQGVIEYFRRVGPPARLVRVLDALGGAYWAAHRIEEAVSFYDRARQAYESAQIEEPDLLARVMGHMAAAHQHVGRHDEAVAAYQAGLAATEKYLDLPRRGHLYEGLAFSYYQAGNSNGALEHARKALRVFEQLHQLRVAARLQHNMAEIVLGMKRPAHAEQLYRRAIALSRRAEHWELVPLSLAALADIALQRGDSAAATELLNEGITEARRLGTPAPLAACQRVAARLAHARRDWAASDASFEEAIRAYADGALIEYLAEAHGEYASCLRERGELARAAAHFEQAYELRRSGSRPVKQERQKSSSA